MRSPKHTPGSTIRQPKAKPSQQTPLSNLPLRCRMDQAADYLNVTERHIRDLVEEGKLAAVQINPGAERAHYRIKRVSLEAFERQFSTL